MVDKITSWKYTEDAVAEDDILRGARARAEELGVECSTASVGAMLAKLAFNEAQIASNRLRVITGKAAEVMANMADAAYDLVYLDADRDSLATQIAESLRMLRPGGALVIAHALWRDRVPDQAMRDEATQTYRDTIATLEQSDDLICSLLPIGDGLFIASKRN